MKIQIESGTTSVKFRAREEEGMLLTLGICEQLAKHLDDDKAGQVADLLPHVIRQHAPHLIGYEASE